jgi:hypothetical protein
MYLLAHVLNGLNRVDPQPTEPERPDSDATLYLHFLISFAIAYVNGAKTYAVSFPAPLTSNALQQQNEDEHQVADLLDVRMAYCVASSVSAAHCRYRRKLNAVSTE